MANVLLDTGIGRNNSILLDDALPLSRFATLRPILISQGENDPRVKRAESEQIVAAMKECGIDHEYVAYENEGHGFTKPENRLDFYHRADQFLARHLGGRAE